MQPAHIHTYHKCSHGTAIVGCHNGTVALLPCCVPNLCLQHPPIHLRSHTSCIAGLRTTSGSITSTRHASKLRNRHPCVMNRRISTRLLACMLLLANSTPMVDLDSFVNSLRTKRLRMFVLPTPESPMSTTLNRKSAPTTPFQQLSSSCTQAARCGQMRMRPASALRGNICIEDDD